MKSNDFSVSAEQRREIRQQADRLLKKAGAYGVYPTPVKDIIAASGLKAHYVQDLCPADCEAPEKVKRALSKLQGFLHRESEDSYRISYHEGDCILRHRGFSILQIFLQKGWQITAACRAETKSLAAASLSSHWECQLTSVSDLVCLSSLHYKCLSIEDVSNPETVWLLVTQPIVSMTADLPTGYTLIPTLGVWPVLSVESLKLHLGGADRMAAEIAKSIPTYNPGMEVSAFKSNLVSLMVNNLPVSPHYYCYAALADRASLLDLAKQKTKGRSINL